VTAAAVLLWVMAAIGLLYAIGTLIVVPGTLDRFRDTATDDPDPYATVVWLGAGVSLLLAVLLLALYLLLGLALRRGSNAARIITLIVCGLGILGGIGTALTVGAQRAGDPVPASLGGQLSDAYPGGWIGTNVALAVAQILGYLMVAALVLTAPREFFGRRAAVQTPRPPTYGMPYPGYPAQGGYPPPGYAAGPPPGPTAAPPPGYAAGPPPGYAPNAYPPPGAAYPPGPYSRPGTPHSQPGGPAGPGAPGASAGPGAPGASAAPGAPGAPMGGPHDSAYARPASVPPHQSFETPPSDPEPEQRDEKH